MTVKVSPKYQVVIPGDVRKSLKITPGMQVSVLAKGGIAYVVPIRSLEEIGRQLGPKRDSKQKERIRRTVREKKDRKL